MSASDPWSGATWMVYGGSQYLKPSDRIGQFTLTAVSDPVTKATVYYRVSFTAGSMPECWQNLLLYPRGSTPFPPPDPLLPPWSPSNDALWGVAADTALGECDHGMSRLEGDLHAGSYSKTLTLVRVANATTHRRPLLALRLAPEPTGGIAPDEDGTGHGGH